MMLEAGSVLRADEDALFRGLSFSVDAGVGAGTGGNGAEKRHPAAPADRAGAPDGGEVCTGGANLRRVRDSFHHRPAVDRGLSSRGLNPA